MPLIRACTDRARHSRPHDSPTTTFMQACSYTSQRRQPGGQLAGDGASTTTNRKAFSLWRVCLTQLEVSNGILTS